MTDKDFEVIIRNTDMQDPDELRDVLAMLGKQVDTDQKKIKRLESQLKRVNAMFPSTARKGK
jgi:hypothetical protein